MPPGPGERRRPFAAAASASRIFRYSALVVSCALMPPPRDRVDGADQGQRHPESPLELGEGKEVLLQAELASVRPAADERMVRHHDDVASSRSLDGARERRHHLVLGVGGAGGARVLVPAVRVEPPLGVEDHEPQPVAGVDDLRAGQPSSGRWTTAGLPRSSMRRSWRRTASQPSGFPTAQSRLLGMKTTLAAASLTASTWSSRRRSISA